MRKSFKDKFWPQFMGGGAGAGAGGSDQMKGRDVAPSVSFVISDTSWAVDPQVLHALSTRQKESPCEHSTGGLETGFPANTIPSLS